MKNNFTFIPNHIEIEGPLPFELLPSYRLRKANINEIREIDKNLNSISSLISKMGELPYAISYTIENLSENEIYLRTETLDLEMCKYYVVDYEGHGELLHKFQLIANLSNSPLELDIFQFEKYKNSYSFSYSPDRAYRFFADNDLTIKSPLAISELENITEIYKSMCDIEEEFHEIKNSIFIFNSLRFLPHYNEYRILGLFTVLESLITHKPSSKETGDSLTHQIKSKIPLLFNRLNDTEEINTFYTDGKLSTIWSKLYTYRSSIAHGSKADFEKDLQLLDNPIKISDYLTLCIKKLILFALREPQFIQDLKKC